MEIARLAPYPLLLLESGYSNRRTFDAACRLARLEPNILLESRSPHTLLALAEAGRGVAIIPSVIRIDRYTLRIVWVTHRANRCESRSLCSGTNGARFRATPRVFANCLTSICARSSQSHGRPTHHSRGSV